MPRKLSFDLNITQNIMNAASDSFIDALKMIDINSIMPTKENFYDISDIELLADDIERQGLKHNLVVSEDVARAGTYWLKSGHRRLAAIKLLANEERIKSKTIPCFIDGAKTKSQAHLDLIMLNATQRKYTDADLVNEYGEIQRLFTQMKEEGNELKGKMREHIAAALNVSFSQVGKIENIQKNAIEEVAEAVKSGEMSISTANVVAKLDVEEQKELLSSKPASEVTHKEAVQKQKKGSEKSPSTVLHITPEERKYPPLDDFAADEDFDDNDFDEAEDTETGEENVEEALEEMPHLIRLTSDEAASLKKHIDVLLDACAQSSPHDYVIFRELKYRLGRL